MRRGPTFALAALSLAACHAGVVSGAPRGSPTLTITATVATTPPQVTATAAPAATPTATSQPSASAPPSAPPSDPFALARSLRYPRPDALAAALANAESAIRSGSASPAALFDLGRSQDAAYHQLVAQPEWQATVLAQLPEPLRPIARANIDAGQELQTLNHPRDTLPAWRILAPLPEGELRADYQEAERLSGIPWQYLAAINLVESRMGRIRGLSAGGAEGPMQFIPPTWAYYGRGDVNNPHDAILAAGRFLADHSGPGDMAKALYGYNPSPHYVRAITIYAQQIEANPHALDGYYNWQVYFGTLTRGDALLPVGWGS